MKITESNITVKDIEIFGRHGVMEQERTVGNEFLVTVSLDFDATDAMLYDNVNHTVNYAKVVEITRDVMAVPSMLIENAAHRLIGSLAEAFPLVTGGTVSVTKVHPPITTPNGGATFTASFKV